MPTADNDPNRKASDGLTGNLRFLVTLAVLAWAIRSFVVAPFSIPSGSMFPTLYVGDYLLVAKWPYGYSRFSFPLGIPSFEGRVFGSLPKRGDVVVFRHPAGDTDLIKRVVAVPGDTVQVDGGRLILNGRPVALGRPREFAMPTSPNTPCKTIPPSVPRITPDGRSCIYMAQRENLPGGATHSIIDQVETGAGDDFPAATVPAGHVFLMGDNRDDSLDSRFAPAIGGVGMVPVDHLIGRALVTFWSTDGSAAYVKPWTWFTALRADRVGNGYSEEPK